MTINVEQKYLDGENYLDCYNCPVAIALFEQTNQKWCIESYRITNLETNIVYRTPEIVSDKMYEWYKFWYGKQDKYCEQCKKIHKGYIYEPFKPKPFSFELEI